MRAQPDEGGGSAVSPPGHPSIDLLRSTLARRRPEQVRLPGVTLRESAVLVPLVIRGGSLQLVVTRRTDTLRSHAGQMAFPGGGRDDADETPLHTALRETEEEVGVSADAVDILGQLDEVPTLTAFRIIPFVGVVSADAIWSPCADEVAEILEVPLSVLLSPGVHRSEPVVALGKTWEVDYYDVPTPTGVKTIWGATARIARSLLSLLPDLHPRG